jgi:5-methylcytosine-specific restriction endonuclease McrA
MTELANNICMLRNQGKTYNEIKSILNCSKGTLCYYLGKNQKEKYAQRRKNNRAKRHPFQAKIDHFLHKQYKSKQVKIHTQTTIKLLRSKIQCFNEHKNSLHKKGNYMYNDAKFSIDDILQKFGQNPICYLTGKPININNPRSYEFDHIIPVSRGGDNSLDNLGLCIKEANRAKQNMTPDELINLCKAILTHNNYTISKQ